MENRPEQFVMERFGVLQAMDRQFDIEYWQRLGVEAIFEAAWQMVVDYYRSRSGNNNELRLQRTVENFQRPRR
jgi:hypothetical protein